MFISMSFFFCFHSTMTMMSFLLLGIFSLILLMYPYFEIYCWQSSIFYLDWFSLILVILNVMIMTSIFNLISNFKKEKIKHLMILLMMTMLVSLCLLSSSVVLFYSFFELSLIPLFFLVLGWGYQPERLNASLSLFFYTIISSMPLLLMFLELLFKKSMLSFQTSFCLNFLHNSTFSVMVYLFFIASMMVKFPLFFFHLWLPKAHVEAPVEGSVYLAAIMLKLGGYGCYRVLPFCWCFNGSSIFQYWSLIGGVMASFICLIQTDMKVLIAYSSVAHMSMAIFLLLSFNFTLAKSSMILLAAHGISSSLMFFGASVFYDNLNTRNMVHMSGILSILPNIIFCWFVSSVSNFAGPPSINFYGEVASIMGLMNISTLTFFPIFFLTFLAAAFTLVMYSAVSQGQVMFLSLSPSHLNKRVYSTFFFLIAHLILIYFWFI